MTTYLDLTPVMSSFSSLKSFDPYVDLDIETLTSEEGGAYDFESIAIDIMNKITEKNMKNHLRNCDSFVRKNLEMIGSDDLKAGHLWYWQEGGKLDLTLVEVPILNPTANSSADMQYLFDMLADDRPYFSIILNSATKRFEVSFKTSSTFSSLAKFVDFPKPTADMLLSKYLADLRKQFIETWRFRKEYIEELCRLCCVTEFQPIDFSFASILIRLKYNKLFTLFMVKIRISGSFPKYPPVLTIYDLQSSSILLLESADFIWNPSDSINTLASKTILFICNVMNERAFAVKSF